MNRISKKPFTRELYETPNITTIGWIDLNSPQVQGTHEISALALFQHLALKAPVLPP